MASPRPLRAQTDLDAFMRQVLASRDANWKKLQQYVLDERELIMLTGPGRIPIWGERHEYPARMFGGTDRRRGRQEPSSEDKARDAQFQRLMNKVALVTLWVEPTAHQIVKYTFDNVGFDFLPAQWLVRIEDFKATMRMGQPFAGVWLPDDVDMQLAGTLAAGQFDMRYQIQYRNYRQPDVTSKVGIKPPQ